MERGAGLVVIDPRRTAMARLPGAEWVPVRPGTDGALALGLCNVLISEELYDDSFVRDWTRGFDEFDQYVQHFRPEVVEGITGVPAQTVRALARRIAGARGAAPVMYSGLEYSDSGVQAIRAAIVLWALAGQLDVPGGRCFSSEFCRRLEMAASGRDKLILFLGGTIGNMDETESAVFLENIGQVMTSRDRFLIGMDMIKPKEVLEAAYNDSQGITAEFNRNILCALNSKFNAGFDVSCFEHLAFYDEEKERVEMHLRAKRDMCTPLKGLDVFLSMKKGETIRTEICRKFTREKIEDMAARAGLRTTRHFTDDRGWFALVEMIKDVQ